MIYGYRARTLNGYGLMEMREVSISAAPATLRDLARFLVEAADVLDSAEVSIHWHMHSPPELRELVGCDVIVVPGDETACAGPTHNSSSDTVPHPADAAAERLPAVQRLESCASQYVTPWLDGDATNADLWAWLRSNELAVALAAAEIIDAAEPVTAEASSPWSGVRLCIDWLKSADSASTSYGGSVTTFLIAAMLLRQHAEGMPRQARLGKPWFFRMDSSNVAKGLLDRCIARLGWVPFNIGPNTPVDALRNAVRTKTPAALAHCLGK